MHQFEQRLRIVLVSPGDVAKERAAAQVVVDELNRDLADNRLVLWQWETDARPGLHVDGPQGLIDVQMEIARADLVVGLFWTRFGTPTTEADSGTEHELRRAWAAWQRQGRPEVMLYFCDRPYRPKSADETTQWGRVLEFQRQLPKEQLPWRYKSVRSFEALLRQHLTRYLRERGAALGPAQQSVEPITDAAGEPTVSVRESPEVSDKDQFLNWREAFDRAAFKGPYLWNTDPQPFVKAISDTLLAVNTGAQYAAQRLIRHGKGKARIENPAWRSEMDHIERELSYIKRSVGEAMTNPSVDTTVTSYQQAHLDPSLAGRIDKARDDIINRLNVIWSELGIPELPVPTHVTTFEAEAPA